MAIPDYQSLMLPVLQKAARGESRIGAVVEELSDEHGLTPEERAELLPSGKQAIIANRVHWAKTYLKQAGLVETTRRGYFRITEKGQSVLSSKPKKIDVRFLSQFPEFAQFRERKGEVHRPNSGEASTYSEFGHADLTPEDAMRSAHRQLNAVLGQEMLDRILAAAPSFFERLIVQLLLAMGYGGTAQDAGKAIGKSGDDGVDGVIDQDSLGLDRVYIQAKRYGKTNQVGPGAIRDFFGSLNMHKAAKGLFVTTSSFTAAAIDTADRLGTRIVLVDGQQLINLMVRYDVGCRVEETLAIKRIDEEFFE
jgi:restriction system protein